MKKLKYFGIFLLRKLRLIKSNSVLLKTNSDLKFNKGDEVRVTIYSKLPEFWYIGQVLDISILNSGRVEYQVEFKPDNTGRYQLRYWFLEDELRFSVKKERDFRLSRILS